MRNIIILLFCISPILSMAQGKLRPELSIMQLDSVLLENSPKQIVRKSAERFVVNDASSGVYDMHYIVTIMDKESEAKLLYESYDQDSKIKSMEAYLYDAFGNLIRKIRKDEYKDQAMLDGFSVYQDNRVTVLEVNHPDLPYTIEWKYTKEVSGIEYALYPDWNPQGYHESVEQASMLIQIPIDYEINIEKLNTDVKTKFKEENGKKSYLWELQNLKATQAEKYGPSSYQVLPKLIISPSQFVVDGHEGSLSSWKDYGQFMNELYEGRDQLPKKVVNEVEALVAGIERDEEKIQILYQYLQEKMRYVSIQLGIGGWQPFDAEYVAENQYGDCKALTNYMMALLKVAGIKSYPALIRNGNLSYQIKENFAHPAFNHVILYIPEHDSWLECTSNNLPPNYIGSNNYNHPVLLITEEGGKIHHTPDQDKTQNTETIKVNIKVETDGTAKVDYQSQLTGALHEKFRGMDNNYSEQDKKEWVLQQVEVPNFKLESFEINAETEMPTSTYNYSGLSTNYIRKSGKRVFVPLNKVSNYGGVPDKMEDRQLPVIHKRDFVENLEIKIELPNEWIPESIPSDSKVIESPFGTYKLSTVQEGNAVTLNRTIAYNRYEGGPESYAEMRKFYRSVNRMEKSQIVLKKEIKP